MSAHSSKATKRGNDKAAREQAVRRMAFLETDMAELHYWRGRQSQVDMLRRDPVDCMNHAMRIRTIRDNTIRNTIESLSK